MPETMGEFWVQRADFKCRFTGFREYLDMTSRKSFSIQKEEIHEIDSIF